MFITTTLPYINSLPHIGHAFEFVLADALVRANKHLLEKNVHFNIGLDEHGLKVWQAAEKANVPVEELISNTTLYWLKFCDDFLIDYTSFYKTSSPEHKRNVQNVWLKLLDQGDIYKKEYTGQYCVGCESFKLNKDLTSAGTCADHPTTNISIVSEENYFFRLSNYVPALKAWLNSSPDFLYPKNSLTELTNILENSEDISISRVKKACPWGVDVPNDESQVMYVWFDALLNYIFAAGYPNTKNGWKDVIQLCGSDNLRFQAIIFQSFLEALDIPHTNHLLVHGTIVDESGQKMSKTLGNGIDPIQQLNSYGLNAVRYYMLAGLNTYQTSSWNEKDLVSLYNSQVVNDWGNLVSRVLHLIDLKGLSISDLANNIEPEFRVITEIQKNDIIDCWSKFDIREALRLTNELVKSGNKYINDNKTWASENYLQELSNVYLILIKAWYLYYPVFPSMHEITEKAIKERKKVVLFPKL